MKMLPLRAAIAAAVAECARWAYRPSRWWFARSQPEGFDMVQYTTAVTADAVAENHSSIDWRISKPGAADSDSGTGRVLGTSAKTASATRPPAQRHQIPHHQYFKPTRDMNADDVVWSFQRQLDPKPPMAQTLKRRFPYFESLGFKELYKSVEKVDDNTVRFTLTRRRSAVIGRHCHGVLIDLFRRIR